MDVAPSNKPDLPTIARERVRIGAVPTWIEPSLYDGDFHALMRGAVTELLIEEQVHAELQQNFIRRAVRLETMQAVQLQSQWRLEFEPQTQSIVLHSIKIRRGAMETEHAVLGRIQFLQREAGLEGCVIDGWVTLLLVLEDVSPGDILEWSYTITNHPRLLPDRITTFFMLPAESSIGKFLFSVRHLEQRALKWKSSSPDLAPTIVEDGEEKRCFWLREKFSSPEIEEWTPAWHITNPWIQISDCPDWQTAAEAVLNAWKGDFTGDGINSLVDEILAAGPDSPTRVNRAVEIVQDRFRYLSVNLEFGGQIPASAETVLRRRYGDCKDLAFLLVTLLRDLKIPARPVLVNTVWQRSIAGMLPSLGIFNHCVVEYEIEGQKRWVDATLKAQGGGALDRWLPDFGLGLPIDTSTVDLVPVPKVSLPLSSFEVKESFILDTMGQPSYLAILITAKGVSAEALRWEFENEGVEAIARKRLKLCANRYSNAARLGQLEYRDDRQINEFNVAEVFEIDGFLKRDNVYNTCVFFTQSEAIADLLCPSTNPRRSPFALPFPCNRTYTIEINFTGFDAVSFPRFQSGNNYFSFTRRSKTLPNFLQLTYSFNTKADSVPPNRLAEHRKLIEPVWQASTLQLRLPLGYARMHKRRDFGALPSPTKSSTTTNPTARISETPAALAPDVVTISGEKQFPAIQPTLEHKRPAPVEPFVPATVSERKSSNEPWRSRGRHRNKRSTHAFLILIGAFLAFIVAATVNRVFPWLASFLFLSAIPIVVGSLVLAAIGLKQCTRHPDRYSHGKNLAIVTLVCGALFGLILVPAIFSGIRSVIAGAEARKRLREESTAKLNFSNLNFLFRSPGLPWQQTDARAFGPNVAVAFTRPESIFFTLCAVRLNQEIPNDKRLIELCRDTMQKDFASCRILSEREAAYRDIAGWQIEMSGVFQGRESFHVYWMSATNGFGYQLVVGGSPQFQFQIREEAARVFSCFESIPSPALN